MLHSIILTSWAVTLQCLSGVARACCAPHHCCIVIKDIYFMLKLYSQESILSFISSKLLLPWPWFTPFKLKATNKTIWSQNVIMKEMWSGLITFFKHFRLWGENFFNATTKKWAKQKEDDNKRSFCMYVLDPIYKVSCCLRFRLNFRWVVGPIINYY